MMANKAEAARQVIMDAGEQWTAMRAMLFEILCQQPRPRTAYQLTDIASLRLGRRVAPNTVYRILDVFVRHGVAAQIKSCSGYVASIERCCGFLICNNCGEVLYLDDAALSCSLEKLASRNGFRLRHPKVEILGLCSHCITEI